MIAMALACRPKLLIADEPTTALDVTIQAQILGPARRPAGARWAWRCSSSPTTSTWCVASPHRVGVMERGRLVETGPTDAGVRAPQHPYTQRLLASRPRAPGPADRRRRAAAGRGARRARQLRHAARLVPPAAASTRCATRRCALRRGETLGIVGESGSGKTTLGMALLALQPIADGEVALGGEPRRRRRSATSLRAMRRRMQVVFQDPFASLSPRMTVGQIVGEGLALHRPELGAAERDALVLQMLDEVGLGARRRRGRRARALSARVLGRPAAAHRDRPRGGAAARGPGARRADLGARRLGAAAGARRCSPTCSAATA